ncbi:MAG TPA: hypothetical protein VLM80_12620 [Anaerolineales bacterium]|nr:hypothetical protein [Anaerolineales bacterium]
MVLLDILLIASGVFLLVYGGLLFRFALAVGAFVLGFSLSMWLLSTQPVATRLLISMAAGGIVAIIGYSLVKMILHFAGAILGTMLTLVILSLMPAWLPDIVILIFIVAGAGVVGFFGNRFGDWVIILATTLAGAYGILLGLVHLFPFVMGVSGEYLSARIPFTAPAFLVFTILFVTGVLAQFEIRRVRGRYVNFRNPVP